MVYPPSLSCSDEILSTTDLQYQGFQKAYSSSLEAKHVGFYWASFAQILEQISHEIQEVRSAIKNAESPERISEEIGDVMHAVLEACFYLNLNPEKILENSLEKFAHRFHYLQDIMQKKGIENFNGNISLALECWEEAKKQEEFNK